MKTTSQYWNLFLHDSEFRFKVTFYSSVLFTFLFALLNAFLGIYYQSIWYGSIAIYFIVLACQRGFVFLYNKSIIKNKSLNVEVVYKKKTKLYLMNGIIIFILVIALQASVFQMLFSKKTIDAGKIVAIANAAYAFYKITMAIIHLVKARKLNDAMIQTVRNISFVDALVSMLSLTVTMLTTFDGDENFYRSMMVPISLCINFSIVIIGITMIVKGIKKLKEE